MKTNVNDLRAKRIAEYLSEGLNINQIAYHVCGDDSIDSIHIINMIIREYNL